MCQLLYTVTETLNMFPVVNFFKMCSYGSRLVFNLLLRHLTLHMVM